jgi:hypothetical protein
VAVDRDEAAEFHVMAEPYGKREFVSSKHGKGRGPITVSRVQ